MRKTQTYYRPTLIDLLRIIVIVSFILMFIL